MAESIRKPGQILKTCPGTVPIVEAIAIK